MLTLWFEHPVLFGLGLFLLLGGALLAMSLFGLRVGGRAAPPADGASASGVGVVEGAVFGLFGLLMAFSFSGAAERFHARRALILEEAQALGTAWSRLDLLPPETQADLRTRMRAYLDRRIEAYASSDLDDARQRLLDSEHMGDDILRVAAAACRDHARVSVQGEVVLPPLNELFDIALARRAATENHPPAAIFGLLIALSLAAAFLVGWSMGSGRRRSRLHLIGFSVMIAATLCVTLDLELPRVGLIQVSGADHLLQDLRAAWK